MIRLCQQFYESPFTFSVVFTLQFVTSRGKSLVERVVKEQVGYVNTNEFTKARHTEMVFFKTPLLICANRHLFVFRRGYK